MNTKDKGNISEAKVITRFIELGWRVSKPIFETPGYDLIVDGLGRLFRVQIKTGRIREKILKVNTTTQQRKWKSGVVKASTITRDEADLVAIYCFENNATYLIKTEDIGVKILYLRIDDSCKRDERAKYAKDFEF